MHASKEGPLVFAGYLKSTTLPTLPEERREPFLCCVDLAERALLTEVPFEKVVYIHVLDRDGAEVFMWTLWLGISPTKKGTIVNLTIEFPRNVVKSRFYEISVGTVREELDVRGSSFSAMWELGNISELKKFVDGLECSFNMMRIAASYAKEGVLYEKWSKSDADSFEASAAQLVLHEVNPKEEM